MTTLQDVQRAVRELGAAYKADIAAGSQRTKDLFAPLIRNPRDGIDVRHDIAYGPHPRQVLDLFVPRGASGADVVVFVHGGAFVRGAKSGPEGLYDNVLTWFARRGFVGVNVEYRLAPEAAYPQGALDVAAAMAWVREAIGAHGGNPQRVLLVGHSAGGTHVAAYAVDPIVGRFGRDARAIVLVSGRLRADVHPDNPNALAVRAYFGDDVGLYDERSPVTHAANLKLPVMLACAEHDNPLLDVYAYEFATRVGQLTGRAPRVVQCMGHNHMSIMAHFDSGEETLGPEILAFWNALR
jgi:acetyl esterase/lipase